ncbi:MAG: hypothetical protein ACJ79D_12310 [Myxococcales bacterium]
MGRSTLIALCTGGLVAALVASHSCSNDTDVVIVQPDAGPICSLPTQPCTGGLACVNRVCTQTCPGGNSAACPPGYYCEGDAGFDEVCAPVNAIRCVDITQCPAPQTCFQGLCASQERLGDGGVGACSNTPPNDGCSVGAICIQNNATFLCVAMPACSQDGTCPVGGFGSTCNVQPDGGRLIEGKQRICLFGLCASNANCPPSNAHCVQQPDAGIEASGCFNGLTNSPCFTNADCNPGFTCTGADGGGSGQCRQ